MSTYRIYVDSRDRKSGTATNFEYALPYTLNIRERSRASVDAVVVPNSIKTVGHLNKVIYVQEIQNTADTQGSAIEGFSSERGTIQLKLFE